MTTLDAVVTLAQQLRAADQLRLIARLAPALANSLPDESVDAEPGNAQALLAALDQIGAWEGDDLDDLRNLVYATRSQVEG